MSPEHLKLTTYFGERDRAGRAYVADALFELYERHRVTTSLLLRGSAGFGLEHHLRTDRLLTLSEDLPLVSIAVDRRELIDALLPEVVEIKRRGLVTLERAGLVTGDLSASSLPEELHQATKLTVYLGRHERVDGRPAFIAVCDLLHRRGVAGATVLLGVDGTIHGRRARARFFSRNAQVPLMVVAVGSGERIAGVLGELGAVLRDPLLTLERVHLCKRDGSVLSPPPPLPGVDEHGLALWQKVMVYTSAAAQHGSRPVSEEIVRRLRRSGARGATTLRGIWGFHGDHAPHGDRLLQLRRRVPAVTTVIDTPQRMARSLEIIDELTGERGLVTSETVPAAQARTGDDIRGGLRLARHPDY